MQTVTELYHLRGFIWNFERMGRGGPITKMKNNRFKEIQTDLNHNTEK